MGSRSAGYPAIGRRKVAGLGRGRRKFATRPCCETDSDLGFLLQTEEAPFALLIAQAALMCLRKGFRRVAAMWYVFAANRLEKCGVVGPSPPHWGIVPS